MNSSLDMNIPTPIIKTKSDFHRKMWFKSSEKNKDMGKTWNDLGFWTPQ